MTPECQRETPADVEIRTSPREPVSDPRLGIDVEPNNGPTQHRLVALGDSLTHGFMSGAVYRTDLSWPTIVAYELGLDGDDFCFPTYEWPAGPGGVPLDLERLARAFEARYGPRLDWWEIVSAGLWVRSYMDDIEDFCERGPGSVTPPAGAPFHNMAVFGWDPLDAVLLDAPTVAQRIEEPADDVFDQVVENSGDRAALVVLQRAHVDGQAATVLETAAAMAATTGGGIETLVVALGANNALGSVVNLAPCWTTDDYLDLSPTARAPAQHSQRDRLSGAGPQVRVPRQGPAGSVPVGAGWRGEALWGVPTAAR